MSVGTAVRVRRRAGWLVAVVVGVGALVAIALSSVSSGQVLDPEDPGPSGGEALAEVLRAHGVRVDVVRSVEDLADADPGPGTTVVMADATYVGQDSAVELGELSRSADRLVLMSPSPEQLAALDLPVTSGEAGGAVEVTAACSSTIARADDTADVVDVWFVPVRRGTGPAATLCFALPDQRDGQSSKDFANGAAMATLPASADHTEVVALGLSSGFTNRWVDEESHAALAVRALGHSPRLLWYQPGVGDLANLDGEPTAGAWPVWLGPASAVVATAVLVLALVRGRRMGALVTEPLPVVVRAVETTESRGRIYRRARDRARAATVLRLGTSQRLAHRLAVPPQDTAAVVRAAAAASGMPGDQVAALLTGTPPSTDDDLHTLANALTDLEERVRNP